MNLSDWLIIAATIIIMATGMFVGLRNRRSYLDIWFVFGTLAANALWLNHYFPPWGARVFFGLIGCSVIIFGLTTWLRAKRSIR